jgi:hypothetical protein
MAPHGRAAVISSAAVSNSLKKNWVVPGGGGPVQPAAAHKRADQSEIDARLKSLMDRLSSQQASVHGSFC